jgi:hypothetical protein
MHWPVPVDVLRPLVPGSLEIDQYEGVAYVGVVPFAMEDVRPKWWPSRLAFSFLETNVRTYVHCEGKPGVFFFSLDAASGLAVWAARRFWGLPYYHSKMTLQREASDSSTHDDLRCVGDRVNYESRRKRGKADHRVCYRVGDPLGPLDADSIEFFFLERYLLFVERKRGTLVGQVHHSPYPAHEAELLSIEDELLVAAGLSGIDALPEFVHFSPGVDVEIFDLVKLSTSRN